MSLSLILLSWYVGLCTTQTSDLKANLVAGHSRKTFRPGAPEDGFPPLFSDLQFQKPLDKGEVAEPLQKFTTDFLSSARETLEHGEEENVFKKLWYDPSYKIHDLCEESNSGKQTGELIWAEPGDRLLKIIGNGVVKNGYNMFLAPGQEQGRRTDVHVAVYIESMSSFKAQTMVILIFTFEPQVIRMVFDFHIFDFEVDMYLAMGWFDRRLAHNCTHPILVTNKDFEVDMYLAMGWLDVTLSCMMDLKLFPIDYQECPLTIQSFAYIEEIVNLIWHVDPPSFPIGSNEEIKLNDM
ncbi:unnamed protein product, partial [Strongylus vulgaris]